ncbi:MAG TPA: lamin tail domain-containing protein [Verrucomicrobiae bacterium]|nr:lamin tail domain-containing protein [Verrucomicrobiae bacterium]
MRKLSFYGLLVTCALILPLPISAQWVAYNDHAPGPGTSQNATTWDVFGNPPGSSGPLKDIATGATLPVSLTIAQSGAGISSSNTQGIPSPGTPVYAAFNGFVDFQGSPSPSIEVSVGGLVTYTFSGLNPQKRYSFMGSAVRGNDAYTNRWTLFELSGALSFTAAHTKNVLTNGNVQLISPSQAALNTGVNHTPETGDMVVWTDIDPGPEGTFSITCQQYDGPVPNGGASDGIKGYGMTGLRLEEFAADTPPAITTQPQSQTVEEAKSVSFSATATGIPTPTLQWFKNNTLITDATNSTYTINAATPADNGAAFKVVASNTINGTTQTATSGDAVLTVIADTSAPTLVDAQPIGFTQVKISFSERVTAATASDVANYSISSANGPLNIVSATLDATETNVVLNVGQLTEGVTYTLSVSNVKDPSAGANVIAAGSQKTFAAITYAPLDIGTPALTGSVTPVTDGYDVRGAGTDIGGTRDQFHFGYQQKTGDFDVRVRIADLTITDPYVKAGLMLRESLTDASRFAAVFASSAQLGSFWESRATVGAAASLIGPATKFPSTYPWAWLRLRRSGDTVTGFGSFDGNAWQQLGTISMLLPQQMFFGMAVTSDATNAVATAKFRDIGPVDDPTLFTYRPERESIGPSNRRTGVIFSEVMYHSKARGDGRSMDFVEIYNGEAIFMDLTGWTISGGIDYAFPAGFKLAAGQFVVIAADPDAIESTYGISGVLGPYQRVLSDTEDTLTLRNQSGAVRGEVTYSNQIPWPAAADGTGHSLVITRPSYGEEDVRAWSQSELIGGSPGFDDPIVPHPWKGVVINEFLGVHQVGGPFTFVELYNASNTAVDLGGCFLSDSPTANRFRIPDNTRIEARSWISFDTQQLGFELNPAGGTLYLVAADQSRVIDCVRFEGQETGVSMGRSPDGSPIIRRLAVPTPGQLNAGRRLENIVINELMYNPISGDPDDQYVEIYNRSNSAVDLSGWRFTSGIDFAFAPGTSIPANGYIVVARDLQRMLTNYTQLKSTNAVGNFDGQLKRGGERVALAKPGAGPNEFVTISEITYMTGGRWSDLANGRGSSLELIDADEDTTLAPNWAGSDESQKGTWNSYEVTGRLDQANQTYLPNKLFIMAHDFGEYLFDDVEVIGPAGTNVVSNSGFETGSTGWNFYGTHRTSVVESGGAFSGANSLHVRASEAGDEGPNSVRGNLSATLVANTTYTLRAKIRWLAGWPEVLVRIRGNGIELPVALNVPKNLGTPGLANSRRVNNAGPAITEVAHYPTLPAANQAVVVTARVSDPDGVALPQLIYRVDPATTTTSTPMRDDGTGGDVLGGDGIFSATIPARASGLVAFRVQAQDLAATSASSVFPNDAPIRECLVRWGDPAPFGSLGHYHLWATATSANDVANSNGQDRRYRDCTIVYDMRVIYNAGWRNKGSPFHSGVGSYSANFSDDDRFLASDKHVFRATGNGGDEATKMAAQMAYWISGQMGLPYNNTRWTRVYRNGALHYPLDYDMEVPDRSVARDWFGGGGLQDTLYKIAGWFEYSDANSGGTSSLIWSTFSKKPAAAPPYKMAAYRYNWQSHPGGKTANDYSYLFNMITAANATDKVTGLMNLADVEQWMRTFAFRRVIGDWDSWSYNTGQNMYMYAPLGERSKLMSWDIDFVLGLGDGASAALFSAGEDGVIGTLFNVPTYRRMLWRAYQDAANVALEKTNSDAQFNSRRAILTKNGVTASAPTSLQSFVSQRRTYLLGQINAVNPAAFTVTTADFTTPSPTATITGTAPFAVSTIEVNGTPYAVTWTSQTSWSIQVPLGAVTNTLNIVAKGLRGNVLSTGLKVTVTYTGAIPLASDWVVINEIMYNALATDAEYIEIYNTHPTYTFDLSGYKLRGADFTFPAGAFIKPNSYLVIAKDSASFAAAYGATIPIIGEYGGRLVNDGETLTLVKPGATSAEDVIIDEVFYDSIFPWPTTANGFGPSLQRVDPGADSWRAGNWSAMPVNDPNRATPNRANVNRATLEAFPQLWINEIVAVNQTGLADGASERDPWIELYNSGASAVDLSTYYLSGDPANPTQWQFPSGTSLGGGQFMVIWLDGQPQQTTATELHANFRPSTSGGVIALSRLQFGAAANVDYNYYPALGADQSYGPIADGEVATQRILFVPTPGGPNNPGEMIVPVSINEWMPGNLRILADPADREYEDWFELYNRGATTIDLTGYFISDETTNSTKFKIPFGYKIPPNGFLLVWADDETGQNVSTNVDLHVNFKLSKDGDTIAIFTPNGALLDSATFPALLDNFSGGRYPDGSNSLFTFNTATPRAANIAPVGTRFTRIDWDGAQLVVGWRTTVGHTYRLEFKADLNDAIWTAAGADVKATGATTTVNVNAPSNRFFRVVQLD